MAKEAEAELSEAQTHRDFGPNSTMSPPPGFAHLHRAPTAHQDSGAARTPQCPRWLPQRRWMFLPSSGWAQKVGRQSLGQGAWNHHALHLVLSIATSLPDAFLQGGLRRLICTDASSCVPTLAAPMDRPEVALALGLAGASRFLFLPPSRPHYVRLFGRTRLSVF